MPSGDHHQLVGPPYSDRLLLHLFGFCAVLSFRAAFVTVGAREISRGSDNELLLTRFVSVWESSLFFDAEKRSI